MTNKTTDNIIKMPKLIRRMMRSKPITKVLVVTLIIIQLIYLITWNYQGDFSLAKKKQKYITLSGAINDDSVEQQHNDNNNNSNDQQQQQQQDKEQEEEVENTSYIHLIDSFNIPEFAKESMSTKCSTYFESLYNYDPDWQIGDLENYEYLVPLAQDRARYEKELFRMRRKKIRGLNKSDRDALKNAVSVEVDQLVLNNLEIENMIYNALGHLKIFGKCALENKYIETTNTNKYKDLEKKLFPWMTMKLPKYKRWDGTIVENRLPLHPGPGLGPEDQKVTPEYKEDSDNFVGYMQTHMSGKGLVISVGDVQVNNTIRLIKSLRYLQNELPIQLVHKGDLSLENEAVLVKAAREDFVLPAGLHHPPEAATAGAGSESESAKTDTSAGSGAAAPASAPASVFYPPQELWFVEASRCIKQSYIEAGKFEMYANKWISVLFTSFDEIIFLDDDAIPFIKPNDFFQLRKYQQSGTVFFKDRYLEHQMEDNFHSLYLSLLPTSLDSRLFEIKQIDPHLLQSRFFQYKSRHMMESGLVVIKRSTHFTGLLISTHLQIWTPTATPVHGDKELFWLGQVIGGASEGVRFNEIPAGASGWIDTYTMQNQLCSIQPSHINDEDGHSLLWVNSGLRYCKYDSWEQESGLKAYEGIDVQDLESKYKSPLLINSVIIPPDNMNSNKQLRGWRKRNDLGCEGYFFCASDKAITKDESDMVLGKLVRFRDFEIEKNVDIAKIWAA